MKPPPIITARVGTYELMATGDTSGKVYDGVVDLSAPTVAVASKR